MSSETLEVSRREGRGRNRAKRVRSAGRIPAVLYGHGQEAVSLSAPAAELSSIIRHGHRVVELKGGVSETAFIREVQWDTYGIDVLHVDFTRVSRDELVTLTVPLELRGEAPGVKQGGVVQHILHHVKLACPVISIPEKIEVRVGGLELNGLIKLSDLALPEGAKLLDDGEEIVAHCTAPTEVSEETPEAGPAEPEIVGRRVKAEEGEEE